MKVKDLPKDMKKLAKKNVGNQGGFFRRFLMFIQGWNIPISQAFIWKNTPEGRDYWDYANFGDFKKAKNNDRKKTTTRQRHKRK